MNEEILLTQDGYDKLVEEHDYLVSVRREEVSRHLKEAKSYGDLSENAESKPRRTSRSSTRPTVWRRSSSSRALR